MITPPSVLFVVPRFHTNIYPATRFLAEAGLRVHVFVESMAKREDHSAVTPQMFRLPSDRARLNAAFRDARPDLVLLRRTQQLNWPIRRLALRDRVPVWTYSLRPLDDPRSLPNKLRKLISGLPLRRVTPVPPLDPAAHPDPHAWLLPWPVIALCSPRPSQTPGALRVLCVAKLGQTRKNILPLLKALTPLGEAGRIQLTLIGESGGGNPDQLATIRQAATAPWLFLHENLPFEEMAQHHADADVSILPAYDEPLGFAPLESMAYGAIPSIATSAGSAGYITHGKNGFRFAHDDMAPLVTALQELIRDQSLLSEMRAQAKLFAETELGRTQFLKRMEALLSGSARRGLQGDAK